MARDRGPRIVAELGRPETPAEAAERKAEARRVRRANQTTFNLVVAVVASLLIAGFFGILMGNTTPDTVDVVDYRAVAREAQPGIDEPLLVPALRTEWRANRAELERGSDDVDVWRIGFVTPSNSFAALLQGVDANPTWLSNRVDGASDDGTTTIGGVEWTVYDRRDADDPGNLRYALATEAGGSTVLLYGTADEAEFAEFAAAVAAQLDADATGSGGTDSTSTDSTSTDSTSTDSTSTDSTSTDG